MKTHSQSSRSNWSWTWSCGLIVFVASFSPASPAQAAAPIQLLDWVEVKDSGGISQQLHRTLNDVTAFFVRVTSPDVPRDSRRLWKISVDGSSNCLLSTDTGVRYPRWGSGGYILYLKEADTNHDGRVDFNDDSLIRIIPAAGGEGRTIAQGKSAVWSPDGRYVGFVRDGNISVATMQGEVLPLGNVVPAGKIVATNSPNPNAAHDFWAYDSRSGTRDTLPGDLATKYLWIGALSPSGSRFVVANTMKTGLEVRDAKNQTPATEIARGDFHFVDPSWSPDEKQIVYVSDRPPTGAPCRAR